MLRSTWRFLKSTCCAPDGAGFDAVTIKSYNGRETDRLVGRKTNKEISMLSSYSVRRPYTVVVAVVIVILLGIISFAKMTTDLLPSIDLPYVMVMTTFPGASPEEVELQVTEPLEQALSTVTNVQNVTSTSSENMSTVILEFTESTNMDSILIEMSSTIDMLEGQWNDSIGTPMVIKINPDAMPVMVAAVDADNMDTQQVISLAEDEVVPAIERLEGVASVTEAGLIETQYEFILDPDKIAVLNGRLQELIDEKIRDARSELDDAQSSLDSGRTALSDNSLTQTEQITQAQIELTNGKLQLAQAETQITVGRAQLQTMLQMAQQTMAQLQAQLDPLVAQRTELAGQISELQSGLQQISDGRTQLQDGIAQIDDGAAQLEQAQAALEEAAAAGSEEAAAQIEAIQEQIAALDTQRAELQEQLAALDEQEATLTDGLSQAQAGLAEMDAGIQQLQQNLQQTQASAQQAQAQMAQLDQAQAGIDAGREQIAAGESQIAQGAGALASGLTGATSEIASAQAALQMGTQQMDAQEESASTQANLDEMITPAMVSQIITAQNFAMPAGYVQNGGEDYLVRVGDKLAGREELENLVLFNPGMDGMDVITAADVGSIEVRDNSDELYAKINGNDGIVLIMRKQSTFSTADVSDDINDVMEKLQADNPALHITTLMDQGEYIDIVIQNVLQNLLYGAILAVIVLLLFLRSLRPTVIVAVSIPISVVFALVLMYFSGVNLNLLSMAGLALGVGMLVDNSIVVIENTFRLRAEGASSEEAAIQGAKQVAGAITASTITTICVFLPIVFTDGISRELFTDMGLTITYSLLASLIVALTLVPAMSASMLRNQGTIKASMLAGVQKAYGRALGWSLKHKAVIMVPVVVLFVWTVANVFVTGIEFMPTMDSDEMTVTVEMPEGATFSETTQMADTITQRIEEIPGVDTVGAIDGSAMSGMMMGSGGGGRSIMMYITLDTDRTLTSTETADRIRSATNDLECDVQVSASTMDISAYTGSGIQVRIEGDDTDAIQAASKEVARILEKTEGTMDVSDGMEQTTPEIRITVDRAKAMEYGLTTAAIFQAVSGDISDGLSAGDITVSDTEYPLVVLERDAQDMTPDQISDIELTGTVGQEKKTVRLGDVSTITEGRSLNSIQRENQVRYVYATAGVDSSHNVGLVSREVQRQLNLYNPPAGISVHLEGENTTIMDALDDMIFMLAVAIGLIYLIMVAQFQSLKSPFIVMFTIPLAFTGGLLGLYMTGTDISVIAAVGFLMLSGIIVNNGIVFVDYINQLKESGMEQHDAIVASGTTRLRPILMTALTTILGLVTMAMGVGSGADMLQPMAIVTIGGLVYGTLLTLFVVPCMYDIFNRQRKAGNAAKRAGKSRKISLAKANGTTE